MSWSWEESRNLFGVLDYGFVAFTFIFSMGIGVYHALKGRGKLTWEDLLTGGRKMSALPIACIIIVTNFSAVAIIGMSITTLKYQMLNVILFKKLNLCFLISLSSGNVHEWKSSLLGTPDYHDFRDTNSRIFVYVRDDQTKINKCL